MPRLLCIFTLGVSFVLAQSQQATVSGTVTDPQSAAVPGVEVVAINTATNVAYRAVTNEAGFYSLRALPIGAYRLTAEKTASARPSKRISCSPPARHWSWIFGSRSAR